MTAQPDKRTRGITAGELCRLAGAEAPDALRERLIDGISTLQEATESQASFLQRENLRAAAENSRAAIIFVPEDMEFDGPGVVKVRDVMAAVLKVMTHFHPEPAPQAFIDPTAVVSPEASLGSDVYIGAHSIIEAGAVIGDATRIGPQCFVGRDARLGAACLLHARVTIMHETLIGSRVIIHPGAVIGADGFRYEVTGGRLTKVPQVGRVNLGDDVEVGANTTIDRAGLTETRIGARTKIDNMVHIGHNVEIGSDCIIVAQVGIAGSAKLGRGVVVGGQTAIKDHVTIGDRARIGGRSGVTNDIAAGADVIGHPPVPIGDYARFLYFVRNFTSIWRKLKPLLDNSDNK